MTKDNLDSLDSEKYYTLKEVAPLYDGHVQALYKRLCALQVPVKIQNGVYTIKGSDVPKILVKSRRGPKASSMNIVD